MQIVTGSLGTFVTPVVARCPTPAVRPIALGEKRFDQPLIENYPPPQGGSPYAATLHQPSHLVFLHGILPRSLNGCRNSAQRCCLRFSIFVLLKYSKFL